MTRRRNGELAALVLPLLDGTRTAHDIAAEIKATPVSVHQCVRQAKRTADLAPKQRERGKPGTLTARIAEFIDGTRTIAEVAAASGASADMVRNAAKRLELDHLLLPAAKGWSGQPKGAFELRMVLPAEMTAWLAPQIPAGGTMADLVLGILVDAKFEETGQ